MVNLQVKDVPDELYQRIRWLATRRDSSIDSVILEAIEQAVRREEWWERWESRPTFDGELDSVRLIGEAREENDRKLADYWDQRERENWA